MYAAALEQLSVSTVEEKHTGETIQAIDVGVGKVRMQEYEGLPIMLNKMQRAGEAKRKAMELADTMMKAPSHAYKIGMLGLGALINKVREAGKVQEAHPDQRFKIPEQELGTSIQPKPAKRARSAKDDAAIMDMLNVVKGKPGRPKGPQQRYGGCTVCKRHGVVAKDKHRAHGNCPFKECVCAECVPNSSALLQPCHCQGCEDLQRVSTNPDKVTMTQ